MDRAEILALAEHRASMCPGGCGHPVEESTAHWTKGPAYDARSTTCRACAALREAQSAAAEKKPDAPAQLWVVHKTER